MNLTQEEKLVLAKLIQKLTVGESQPEVIVEQPVKKKRGRPKKTAVIPETENIVSENVVEEEKTVKKTTGPKRRGKSKKGEGGEKTLCRVELLDTTKPRENKFLEMAEFHMKKEDSKIDQAIKRTVTPRNRKPALLNGVICRGCEDLFDEVPASECYSSDEGKSFLCPSCTKVKARGQFLHR